MPPTATEIEPAPGLIGEEHSSSPVPMPNLDAGRFTAAAFRALVRARSMAGPSTAESAVARAEVTVPRFDRAPDVADAWVFGAFMAVLDRIPEAPTATAFANAIRSGTQPEDLVAGLVRSDEGVQSGAEVPESMDTVFVIGVYLVCLGRLPDELGLATSAGALAAGALAHHELLTSTLTSTEAERALRFPPPPPPPSPPPQRSPSRAARMDPARVKGLPTRTMLRQVARRQRSVRSAIREVLSAPAVSRLVTVESGQQIAETLQLQEAATGRLAVVGDEVAAGRRFQWTVDQKTWERLDGLAVALQRIEARLADLERAGGEAEPLGTETSSVD